MLSSRILRDGGYKFSSKVYSILVGIQDFGYNIEQLRLDQSVLSKKRRMSNSQCNQW